MNVSLAITSQFINAQDWYFTNILVWVCFKHPTLSIQFLQTMYPVCIGLYYIVWLSCAIRFYRLLNVFDNIKSSHYVNYVKFTIQNVLKRGGIILM